MKVKFMGFDEATIARFWSKVDKHNADQCWNWLLAPTVYGYGQFWHKNKTYRAHRIALALTCDAPHGRDYALHKCDNKLCCNPRHLYWGTISENVQDALKRNSHYKPRRRAHILKVCAKNAVTRCKLTQQQVIDILSMAANNTPHREIARHFGVAKYTIFKIIHGKTPYYSQLSSPSSVFIPTKRNTVNLSLFDDEAP